MKTLLTVLILFVFFTKTNAQFATYTPKGGSFSDSITITINLNLADGPTLAKILNSKEPLYLWAGAGTSTANPFEYAPKGQTNFNAAFEPGLLTNIGINKYQITILPTTYFNIPTNKTIKVIGLLIKNAAGNGQTSDFVLEQNTAKQTDVVVISKKPFIENQLDKVVLNVQNDITSVGSTVFEILKKAPGITITNDDNIKLAGKGTVNVLIDGRPSQMSPTDLANYLKGTPGSNIDKIEIIANPSSKYDAQGGAGIINIKFKRSKNLGTNGNINTDYNQNVHNRYGVALNVNNRTKIANTFGNFGIRQSRQNTDGGVDRTITDGPTKFFENKTVDQDRYKGANFRLGTDFFINKKSTFGFLTTGNFSNSELKTPGITLIKNAAKIIDSSIITNNIINQKATNSANNLNYAYEDTLGNQLNADIDYVYFKNTSTTNTITDLLNNANTVYGKKQNILNTSTLINIYGFKIDYVKTLKSKNAKFEAGVKTNAVNTTNNLDAQKLAYGIVSKDSLRSNLFDYKENVNAAYINYSKEINKQFAYQVGLRMEQTNVKGKSTDVYNNIINNPDTSYLNLFPSAFLRYTASKSSQIIASYTRRLNRPNYQAMNPFETIIDIYTAERGNPYLKPEYYDNYELKYIYKEAASLGAGYTQTNGFLQGIVSQEGEKTYATQKNLGQKQSIYFQFNLPFPITKKYFMYAAFTAYNNRYKGTIPEGTFNVAAWGFNGFMNHDFTLPKQYKLQLSGWWQMPGLEGIGRVKAFGSLDFGLQKQLLKQKLSLRLAINDIFNTQRYQEGAVLNTINYSYFRKWESRGIAISLNYKFGNNNVKQSRDRNTSEDANRIKQKN